jgi:hypothetical protein
MAGIEKDASRGRGELMKSERIQGARGLGAGEIESGGRRGRKRGRLAARVKARRSNQARPGSLAMEASMRAATAAADLWQLFPFVAIRMHSGNCRNRTRRQPEPRHNNPISVPLRSSPGRPLCSRIPTDGRAVFRAPGDWPFGPLRSEQVPLQLPARNGC